MHESPSAASRPRVLFWFEAAFLAAMLLYPAVIYTGRHLAPPFDPASHGLLLGAMVAAQLMAMFFAARRGKNWARWLICILLPLDIPMYMALVPESSLQNSAFIGLSAVQLVLHTTAAFLLFAPSVSVWVKTEAS